MKIINTVKYLILRLKNLFPSRKTFYLGNFQSLTRLNTRQVFFVDTRDISLTPTILLTGQWEPWLTKIFLKTVKPGMTVIDVGCHMGYYTVLAGTLVGDKGKVYAFEANPTIFETLFKNVFANGLLDRVKIENKAVYSHSTKLNFSTLKRATGGNSLVTFSDTFQETFQEEVNVIEVEAISLDEYFEKITDKIDIMKIDAEGSEPYIFKGMKKILEKNPQITIFCEFDKGLISGTGANAEELLNDLEEQGFKFFKVNFLSNIDEVTKEKLLEIGRADLILKR